MSYDKELFLKQKRQARIGAGFLVAAALTIYALELWVFLG